MKLIPTPTALFDSLEFIDSNSGGSDFAYPHDYKQSLAFLKSYRGSLGTFNSYRREVERLLHWSALIEKKMLKDLRRDDIENYVRFCQQPPPSWIGIKKSTRFIEKSGERIPNKEWRPFVVTIKKAAHRQGKKVDINNFELSQGALKELFAILSTFFNYLLQEEYVYMNPVSLIRQKSKFIRKQQAQTHVRRLTALQWEYVIETANSLALENPKRHHRTLFIMTALFSLYLRISELTATTRWVPKMCDFYRDHDGNWWFKTVGKGNKERQIAVSNVMLDALRQYRQHLGLSALPALSDTTPLLSKIKGKGPITSTTYLREIVQGCFDHAISNLNQDGHREEAELLNEATVHWLRHTGISEDVKRRPREHVRDDAGHSSSATTDKYIDVEMRERHKSAKNKPISA